MGSNWQTRKLAPPRNPAAVDAGHSKVVSSEDSQEIVSASGSRRICSLLTAIKVSLDGFKANFKFIAM